MKKGAETSLVWGGEECASGSKSKAVRRLFLKRNMTLTAKQARGKSVYG